MPESKSQIIRAYGGRPNFQHSMGLKMTPDDIEEGNRILEAFMEADEGEKPGEEAQKGIKACGLFLGRLSICSGGLFVDFNHPTQTSWAL